MKPSIKTFFLHNHYNYKIVLIALILFLIIYFIFNGINNINYGNVCNVCGYAKKTDLFIPILSPKPIMVECDGKIILQIRTSKVITKIDKWGNIQKTDLEKYVNCNRNDYVKYYKHFTSGFIEGDWVKIT